MSHVTKVFSSLQTRLLVVFFINALLTLIVVMAFNQWLRSQLITEADNALLVNATQVADRIDEFNRSNQQVFNAGSRLPDLVGFLLADEALRQNPDFQKRVRITLDTLEVEPWDEYYILSQALIDPDGRNIMDTATENIGADESGQEYFRAALLGGAITISPLQFRPDRGGIYFYYAVPLRDDDPPNSVIGVLRIQMSVSSVQNVVFDSVRGHDLNVSIFNENHVRVIDTRRDDLLFRSIATYSPEQIAALKSQYALPPLADQEVSVPLPDLVKTLVNTHQDRVVSGFTAPDAEGEERLAIVRLDTLPWTLIVSQPSDQYYGPVQQQTRGLLVLMTALVLVALLSSYLFARRLTRPIRVLTATATQVAKGNLHIKAPITSRDEIGLLAQTFNLMTTQVEQAQATLEERVNQRTQELSETNERLKHEIVERQRYEKQALDLAIEHERRRILSEFIQKASHEFKTPLSVINVNAYLARRFLPEDRQRHINTIEEQGRHIERLVNRMVLMTRLDSGMSPVSEEFQVDEFVRTLHTNASSAVEEKRAVVHLDLQAAGTSICADSKLLFVALQNILENALKYSAEQVEISLRTRANGETVTIMVQDNGIGIPAGLQGQVFERFFRVDEAHTTRGFGLGLPIAKRIIEDMGGTIDLHSAEGEGTTVTVTLAIKPRTPA